MTKKFKNIYIPVEITNRDFLSRLLIAYHAAEEGFKVYLGSKQEIENFVKISKPGIYLGLVTTKTYANFYQKLKDKSFEIYVIDEEGLVTFDDAMYLDLKVSNESLKNINALFTWGCEHNEIITKKYPNYRNKIIDTGSPRFDLFNKEFIPIYNEKVEKIKHEYRQFTLICGSFSFVNHFNEKLNYVKVLRNQHVLKNSEDERKFLDYCAFNKNTMLKFTKITKQLAEKNPSHNFIYRPHPAENPNIYLNEFKNYKNIKVLYKYSLIEWILASKAVVHAYCTSSIEAFFVDIPRFGLIDNDYSHLIKSIPYDCSKVFDNEKNLLSALNQYYNSNYLYKENRNHISERLKKFITHDQNEHSAKAIIDNIKILNNVSMNENNIYIIIKFKLFIFLKYLKNFIYIFDHKFKRHKKYITHKVGHITLSDLKINLNYFDIKNKLSVKEISKNLFCLIK